MIHLKTAQSAVHKKNDNYTIDTECHSTNARESSRRVVLGLSEGWPPIRVVLDQGSAGFNRPPARDHIHFKTTFCWLSEWDFHQNFLLCCRVEKTRKQKKKNPKNKQTNERNKSTSIAHAFIGSILF